MHEICAPSDTIMLKSDSYGQKYLSRQYHKIVQLNFIEMTFALFSSVFFAMSVFSMCVESNEVFK